MLIIYYSRFGNTYSFIKNHISNDYKKVRIENIQEDSDLPQQYVLFTPTYNFGEIPEEVVEFLDKYHSKCLGTVVNGNRNWGDKFANAGRLIQEKYGIPCLYKYEMRGNKKVAEEVEKIIEKL